MPTASTVSGGAAMETALFFFPFLFYGGVGVAMAGGGALVMERVFFE